MSSSGAGRARCCVPNQQANSGPPPLDFQDPPGPSRPTELTSLSCDDMSISLPHGIKVRSIRGTSKNLLSSGPSFQICTLQRSPTRKAREVLLSNYCTSRWEGTVQRLLTRFTRSPEWVRMEKITSPRVNLVKCRSFYGYIKILWANRAPVYSSMHCKQVWKDTSQL